MSDQINLVSHRRKRILNRESLLTFVQLMSRIILAATIICSVGIFVLNRSGKLPLLQEQDKTVSTNLSFLQQKIVKFLLIRERLQNIDPIISKKSNIVGTLAGISQSIPSGVLVDTFTLDQSKNINIEVSSPSLTSINSFLDFAITKVNQKELFKKVTISGLTLDSVSGKYTLVLSAIY